MRKVCTPYCCWSRKSGVGIFRPAEKTKVIISQQDKENISSVPAIPNGIKNRDGVHLF